jgi:hypothetical protein
MRIHPIHVTDGRSLLHRIREELFAFSQVLEVYATGRADVLVVVCWGRPRAAEWLRALRAAGYDVPAPGHRSHVVSTYYAA